MKRCPKCGLSKEDTCFYKDSRLSGGLSCWCKQCDAVKRTAYRARTGMKERLAKLSKEYRSRPEVQRRIRERDNAERRAHPEKACERSRRWYHRHIEVARHAYLKDRDRHLERTRNCRLKRVYGITPEQVLAMLVEQGGRCRICGADSPGKNAKSWSVDHDHVTGQVRGLLCRSCNVGLGHFRDSAEILAKAVEYLESSRKAAVPPKEAIRA